MEGGGRGLNEQDVDDDVRMHTLCRHYCVRTVHG